MKAQEINFRDEVTELGKQATAIMQEYFAGKRQGTDMVREASRILGHAIKVEHINQIKNQQDRSMALRLMQFLPKNEEVRKKYIELMNPELKPILLLGKPNEAK